MQSDELGLRVAVFCDRGSYAARLVPATPSRVT
jgi:hypothetical protein